ncbi:MAG: carbamoyltransferase HypF [Acidobacteria bacterium]|nr:carbamoyltransferase HypF [Acidobacteriota bacterium]
MLEARRISVRGIVQGVGFRPFVFRLAERHGIAGWVLNGERGVEIHAEGTPAALAAFQADLVAAPPPAARIASWQVQPAELLGHSVFAIRTSARDGAPTVRVAPDLPVCDACLSELRDRSDRRAAYPYINCTDCGPRFSIVLGLPYDRPRTTMKDWPLCAACAHEYEDPRDRRFHAQPVACPACGPGFRLLRADGSDAADGAEPVAAAAAALAAGSIVATKGIGGYHLACDARQPAAVAALRARKFRKERPFAVMARDLAEAEALVVLDAASRALLLSSARPIVLAPARAESLEVAPGYRELGVMLPYAPLHHLLFAAGAPAALVMTSANRSSEPIAYRDDEALSTLGGIADLFLVGERPIARRVDDSVARAGPFGPTILRRSRGYAPAPVASFPAGPPILATGADLKNAIALVVGGQAFVSQHVGDLDHLAAREAFAETIRDLCAMWEVDLAEAMVAHDLHPDYHATRTALAQPARRHVAVQHHRAHVASVLAERGAWETPVVGLAWDGTGYGDDGTIWGGEVFRGTLAGGLVRVAHLATVQLPGGDAAALFPPQCLAGFVAALSPGAAEGPDVTAPTLAMPTRYALALSLASSGERVHASTSIGRLFDALAALCGFTREITFEGQAAMALEQLALGARAAAYPLPWQGDELDWRPLLAAALEDRRRGRDPAEIARAAHEALADAAVAMAEHGREAWGAQALVLSGGVFQNALLLELIRERAGRPGALAVWVQREVPPNDGGIALGQAAVAATGLSGSS